VVVAQKVITFDSGTKRRRTRPRKFNGGSKRRLKQIRWKLVEVFSLALLVVFLFAMSILVMMWEMHDVHPDPAPSSVPQIRDAEPNEP
jgi:hypothetical protein